MHQLFSSKQLSSRHHVSLSLAIFFLGATLHAQQTTFTVAPSAPTQIAAASPTLNLGVTDLTIPPYISSSADPDQPAPPADIDAPQAQSQSTEPPPPKQTSRILGILPNFRAVSADVKLPPQTVKEKFKTAFEDSFDYSAIFVPAALAGYNLARNADPEFGTGGLGYARYLWHAAADQTIENFMVEAIVPTITRQDNRYYTLGRGGFWKRTGYAISRVVITRNDAGHEVFNSSEVVGAGAAAGISTLYYPSRERNATTVIGNWGINVGIDGVSFIVKEFWPDINHALFHGAKPSDVVQHQ